MRGSLDFWLIQTRPRSRASPFHDESKKRSRIWGAGLPICWFPQRIRSVLRPMSCRRSYSSPSRRALQSPRRPACRPSGLWPVASACAAGSYPEDRTGHSLPALRACTLPAGRVRQGQPQPEPRGHAMRVCCLSCTDGWTDSLASRQRRSHSRRFPAFAVRCRGQCGAGSERCGEPGVSAHCPQW